MFSSYKKGTIVKKTLIAATLTSIALGGAASANAQNIQVIPSGSSPSTIADPRNFSGHVVVDLLTPPSIETPAASGLVTFAPRARTAWHTHPAGQMLIVTAGKGWVQRGVDPRRRPAGWPRCRLRPGQDGIAGQGDRRHPELSAWRLRLLRTPGD
jgi:hypothetical protein